jgi:hypothetical protein
MEIQKVDLKQEIYNYLNFTDDVEILTKVRGILSEQSQKTDWWDELTEKQKEMIKVGTEQLNRGEGIPHEIVMAKMNAKYGS